MFLKTLLKGYVHILDIKWHCIVGILILFQKNYAIMKLNTCHIIFLFGKTTKIKNFLNPSSVHHFSSILCAQERWTFPSSILSYRHDMTLKFVPRIPLRSDDDWWRSCKWCVIYRPKTNFDNVIKNVNWRY